MRSDGEDDKIITRKESFMKKALSIILIAVMLCGALLMLGCKQQVQQTPNQVGVGLVVDPNQGDYVAPETNEPGENDITIPGWGKLTIPPNTKEITVDFYNPEENKDKFYLTFELRLPDGSEQGYEVLYKSGLIEPGKHIQKITLSKGLAEGEYDVIMRVQPYTISGQTPTNNVDSNMKLIVK